jgi:DNA polymerase (family X)
MLPLEAGDVAKLLAEMGERSALADESPYRSRAYLRAARNLAGLPVTLAEVIESGRLKKIPGVGDAIARVIISLQRTGSHPALEALRAEAPYSLVELVNVPALPSGLIMKLYREFGIASLDSLEDALREQKIKGVKGFGPAVQKRVLEGIAITRHSQGAVLLDEAEELLETAADSLPAYARGRICFAGEFRRGCELVADLGLAAESTGPAAGAQIEKTANGCKLHLSRSQGFGCALLFATGSKAHLNELLAIARKKRMELTPAGLYRAGKALPSST